MQNSQNRLSWLALFAAGLLIFTPFPILAQVIYVPTDVGTSVNGFQDDFNGTSLGANWTATGTSLGIYTVSGGMLHVTSGTADPNHLLYTAPGYNNTVQEVLMRIRVTNFGANLDPPRAGAGVGWMRRQARGLISSFGILTDKGWRGVT